MTVAIPHRSLTLRLAGAQQRRFNLAQRLPRPLAALCNGLTLVEMLVTLAIAALITAGLVGVMSGGLNAGVDALERNALARDARFAMQRMVHAVSRTRRLALPLGENPNTAWSESDRDPGVLAVSLDPTLDRDGDGIMDADNDGDGLIDEDLGMDNYNNGEPGIIGIDDDGDGQVDERAPDDGTPWWNNNWYKHNDDEDLMWSEEILNGIDDDGDGMIDEDTDDDMDTDWYEWDEDYYDADDDGDGTADEDWYDVVVYHLVGTTLVERMPNINPSDGADYSERVIADGVTQFRVVRIPQVNSAAVLVDITLVLGSATASTTVQTRVRVGAGL